MEGYILVQLVALENKHLFEQCCTTIAMQHNTCKIQCVANMASYLQTNDS